MIRSRCLTWVRAARAVVASAVLMPAAASAQIADTVRGGRPLIAIDDVVLRGGTPAEQQSLLRLIQPAIESIDVLRGPAAVQRFGEAAREGAILVRLRRDFARPDSRGATGAVTPAPIGPPATAPLVTIDGIIVPATLMRAIMPDHIERIEVLKGPAALERFGAEGLTGVIQITLRKR